VQCDLFNETNKLGFLTVAMIALISLHVTAALTNTIIEGLYLMGGIRSIYFEKFFASKVAKKMWSHFKSKVVGINKKDKRTFTKCHVFKREGWKVLLLRIDLS